jgi:hypothetical protein
MNVADKLVGFSRQESIEPVLSAHAFWAHLSSMVALGDYQLTGKSQTQHPQTVVLNFRPVWDESFQRGTSLLR